MTAAHTLSPESTIESRSPATGEVIGTVAVLNKREVNEVVGRARHSAAIWGQLSHHKRYQELAAWRRALAQRADELAMLVHRENGKPLADAMAEIMLALSHLDHAAKRAPTVLATEKVPSGVMANYRATISYHPLGVVGVIGPWNYPIFTPMGSIAYALAAGNTVVFKPSELTPLIGEFLAETARASMSVPDVFLVVTGAGATGAALAAANVDKLAFTGSAATGRKVMAAAAERLTPVLMELGGKDPMIVAADADIDKAADAAVFGALQNAGQACTSIERCYVVDEVYDRFLDKVVEQAHAIRAGSGDGAKIGAITRPEQIDIIRDHLEDALAKGATCILGGPDKIRGNFVEPTVLVDVTNDMKVMREETFGPVLPIARVPSIDEAVRQANDSSFGLGSAVFGKRGVRELAGRIRAGMTSVNSVVSFAAIPSLPFGGIGESGFGRIHGDAGLLEFVRAKGTAEERVALPLNLLSFNVPDNIYDRIRGMMNTLYGGGVIDRATGVLSSIRQTLR